MTRIRLFALMGMLLVASGVSLLLLQSTPVRAQEDNDYIGADECASCHRALSRTHDESLHALTLQEDEDAILADFDLGEDARMVQFPEEAEPRPFDEDDVEFTLGTGQYVQRYLYRVGRDEFRILPAEWVVATGEWRALDYADSWDDPAYDWEQSCVGCHTTGYDVERERWEDDGVQCEACHGPGEIHADLASDAGRRPSEEELAEVRASINPGTDPQICGSCHSQGTNEDGLPFPAGYVPGTDLSETFAIVTLEQTDHWWVDNHANDKYMQYNEWITTGHADALSVMLESDEADDSCLTCHSADYTQYARIAAEVEAGEREGAAPTAPTTETAQFGVTCVSCHDPHSEAELPAQMIGETYALCVSCHSDTGITEGVHHPVQEMFEGTDMIEGIPPEVGVHFVAEDGPTCTTCHAATVPVGDAGLRVSHSLTPILPGTTIDAAVIEDSCSTCHEDQAQPELLNALITDIQTNTRARIDTARAAITATTPEWVIRALDFVEGDGSLGIHNYAYSDTVLDAVYAELGLFPAAGQ